MKKRKIFFQLFIAAVFTGMGQLPNPLNFNTAINATQNGTIATTASDLNWTAALSNSLGTYVSPVPAPNPGWMYSPSTLSNWITYPHTCTSGDPAEHSCLGNIDVYYKLSFNLPSTICGTTSVTSPGAYCVSMDLWGDNCISAVFVNGVLNYTTTVTSPYGYTGFNSNEVVTVNLCNNWQAGANSIIVLVKSGAPTYPGWEGFLAVVNANMTTSTTNTINATVSHSNVQCFGGNNGSATVAATYSGSPFSYSWSPSGGVGPVANGLAAGTYTCRISNSSSCPVTRTITITQPSAIVLGISASSPTACVNSSVQLTSNMSGGTPGYTYVWSPGGGLQSTVSANQSMGGNYIYTVTGKDAANCTKTATVALKFVDRPTLSIAGKTVICKGESLILTGSGASTYTWNNTVNGATISISPSVTTIYTLAASNGTCSNSKTVTVNVQACVGLNEIGEVSDIHVFPNPVSDQIILYHESVQLEIRLFDQSGKCVHSSSSTQKQTVLNISDLPSGIYFLNCSGEGKQLTKKILKE